MAEAMLSIMQETGVEVEDAGTMRSYSRLGQTAAIEDVFDRATDAGQVGGECDLCAADFSIRRVGRCGEWH